MQKPRNPHSTTTPTACRSWKKYAQCGLLGALSLTTALSSSGCATMLVVVLDPTPAYKKDFWVLPRAITFDIVTSPIQLAILSYFIADSLLDCTHEQLVKFDASLQIRWWESALSHDISHLTSAEARRHLSHQESREFIEKQLRHYQENPPAFDLAPLLLLLDDLRYEFGRRLPQLLAGFDPLPEELAYRMYACVLEEISSDNEHFRRAAAEMADTLLKNSSTPPEIVRELRSNPALREFAESQKPQPKKKAPAQPAAKPPTPNPVAAQP